METPPDTPRSARTSSRAGRAERRKAMETDRAGNSQRPIVNEAGRRKAARQGRHSEATPKPPRSHLVANRSAPGSHPEATLKTTLGLPKASPKSASSGAGALGALAFHRKERRTQRCRSEERRVGKEG